MNDNRARTHKHSQADSRYEEWPEKMNLTKARKFLGISFSTMSILVGSGKLATEHDPLDRRVKLVKRADLEDLLRIRNNG
jgi:hypothetical protein